MDPGRIEFPPLQPASVILWTQPEPRSIRPWRSYGVGRTCPRHVPIVLVERTKLFDNFYVLTTFKFALQTYFVVDPGRLELPFPQCECGVLPLDHGPLNRNEISVGLDANPYGLRIEPSMQKSFDGFLPSPTRKRLGLFSMPNNFQ